MNDLLLYPCISNRYLLPCLVMVSVSVINVMEMIKLLIQLTPEEMELHVARAQVG